MSKNNAYTLLREAVEYEAKNWGCDSDISGADLVEWFADWRQRAERALGRDERELNGMRISNRELATVLAALRNLQLDLMQPEFRNGFKHQEHFVGGIKPLTDKEIDRLCERINQ